MDNTSRLNVEGMGFHMLTITFHLYQMNNEHELGKLNRLGDKGLISRKPDLGQYA